MFEATIPSIDPQSVLSLFGPRDLHLRALRDAFGVSVTHRDGSLHVRGEEAAVAKATLVREQLKVIVERSGQLEGDEVLRIIERASGKVGEPEDEPPIDVVNAAKRVVPRTPGQARYVKAIRAHDLTFA